MFSLGNRIMMVVIAVIAIAAGTFKYCPHLVFSLPNGFILHAISGGDMPPFFDATPYALGSRNAKNNWLKPNDVIVSTAAKSGTTWMLFCSHQVRVRGDDETYPYVDTMLSTPWPELIQVPGETWEERLEKMNDTILPNGETLRRYWDHPDYKFRIFKSHFTPDKFGDLIGGGGGDDSGDGDAKVKFLAMARNGLDQVTSAVPFFDKHEEGFRKIWGSFPPEDGGSSSSGEKRRKVASERLNQMLPGNVFGGWHFDYVNKWWKVKDEKNVLLLHYSDAKKDLRGTVLKLADFYNIRLNEEETDKVAEKCSFDYMKKNGDMFLYSLPLHPTYNGRIMQSGSMTRKGAIGDGQELFSEEEKEMWSKAEEEQFGDDINKLNWARSGEASQ
jgi:hypothetical protein